MIDPSLKEKAIKMLLVVFVIFLVASFAYFLLSPPKKGQSETAKIYFFKSEKLTAVERTVTGTDAPKGRIDALLVGPSKKEAQEGLFTEIPKGTRALKAFVEGDTAYVDFNSKLGEYGGGSTRVQGMIMQIVYTLTEVPGIKKVGIMVNGKSEVVLGGEGYVIEKPLSRKDVNL